MDAGLVDAFQKAYDSAFCIGLLMPAAARASLLCSNCNATHEKRNAAVVFRRAGEHDGCPAGMPLPKYEDDSLDEVQKSFDDLVAQVGHAPPILSLCPLCQASGPCEQCAATRILLPSRRGCGEGLATSLHDVCFLIDPYVVLRMLLQAGDLAAHSESRMKEIQQEIDAIDKELVRLCCFSIKLLLLFECKEFHWHPYQAGD